MAAKLKRKYEGHEQFINSQIKNSLPRFKEKDLLSKFLLRKFPRLIENIRKESSELSEEDIQSIHNCAPNHTLTEGAKKISQIADSAAQYYAHKFISTHRFIDDDYDKEKLQEDIQKAIIAAYLKSGNKKLIDKLTNKANDLSKDKNSKYAKKLNEFKTRSESPSFANAYNAAASTAGGLTYFMALFGNFAGCGASGLILSAFLVCLLHIPAVVAPYFIISWALLSGTAGVASFWSNARMAFVRSIKKFVKYLYSTKSESESELSDKLILAFLFLCAIIVSVSVGTINYSYGPFLASMICNGAAALLQPLAIASMNLAVAAPLMGSILSWVGFVLTFLSTATFFIQYLPLMKDGMINAFKKTETEGAPKANSSSNFVKFAKFLLGVSIAYCCFITLAFFFKGFVLAKTGSMLLSWITFGATCFSGLFIYGGLVAKTTGDIYDSVDVYIFNRATSHALLERSRQGFLSEEAIKAQINGNNPKELSLVELETESKAAPISL